MSTNFYARGHRHDMDPAWHVGKRTGGTFILAMSWERFQELCGPCLCKKRFVDEYGEKFTGSDLERMILTCELVDDESSGGEWFS